MKRGPTFCAATVAMLLCLMCQAEEEKSMAAESSGQIVKVGNIDIEGESVSNIAEQEELLGINLQSMGMILVRVTLKNTGPAPQKIELGRFSLLVPDGQKIQAVPPTELGFNLMRPIEPVRVGIMSPEPSTGMKVVASIAGAIFPPLAIVAVGVAATSAQGKQEKMRERNITSKISAQSLFDGDLDPGWASIGLVYFRPPVGSRPFSKADLIVSFSDSDGKESSGKLEINQIKFPSLTVDPSENQR